MWVKVGNIIHGETLEKEDGEAPWSRLCQIRECWIHERLRRGLERRLRLKRKRWKESMKTKKRRMKRKRWEMRTKKQKRKGLKVKAMKLRTRKKSCGRLSQAGRAQR